MQALGGVGCLGPLALGQDRAAMSARDLEPGTQQVPDKCVDESLQPDQIQRVLIYGEAGRFRGWNGQEGNLGSGPLCRGQAGDTPGHRGPGSEHPEREAGCPSPPVRPASGQVFPVWPGPQTVLWPRPSCPGAPPSPFKLPTPRSGAGWEQGQRRAGQAPASAGVKQAIWRQPRVRSRVVPARRCVQVLW